MFYTYLWLRENGTPYYVGKGSGHRAYEAHRGANKKSYAPPKGRIVFYIAKDEADAFEMEKLLIWYYGRKDLGTGCLRNFTDGGDGVSNYHKGKPWSAARRAAHKPRVAWNRGLHPSQETIEKMRVVSTGRVISVEQRAKMGKSISEARRLRPYGIGRAPWNKGTGMSLEQKQAKARERGKVHRAKKKAQERLNEQSINS